MQSHESQRLVQCLKNHDISRRTFMSQAMALGLTVGAASTLANSALASTPKRGGVYRVGASTGSPSNVLDPALSGDTSMRSVTYAISNCLIEVAPDGQLIPELAESWETSDGLTWAFNIRKGVEFHNGRSLTPTDVVASINHHRGEASKSSAKALVDEVEDISIDGNSVVMKLSQPNVGFSVNMSFWQLNILPANEDGSIEWQSGVGSGGYSLVDFQPGIGTKFKRNPNYWKEGRAHFDEVEMSVIVDTTARTTALTTGEIDAMEDPDAKTVNLLKRQNGINIIELPGKKHYTYAMLTDHAPFDNVDVRLALKLAIDRQALIDTVLSGHGSLANDNPIGSFSPNFANMEQRQYDPDRAKFHLKQAGFEGLSVDLHVANIGWGGVNAVDGAVLYQENAAKAGIELKVVRESDDGYWTRFETMSFRNSNWNGRPSDEMMFTTAHMEGAPGNEDNWKNKRFNEVLAAVKAELDEGKRKEMHRELQQLIRDDSGVIIPAFANIISGTSDQIHHGEVGPDWELDGARHIERWWFA